MLLRTKNSKLVLINVIIYLFLTAEIRCAVKNKDLATKGAYLELLLEIGWFKFWYRALFGHIEPKIR
ncbi:hypothetical protein TNIN_323812 [Trichonephila inaurata madagascariensis]|uniref:Uncharacterized protein n=1 Tax=Trichonephila inaurata madagascariensis TaxID=2747483 RepID=A0A8X7C405_9ARAC|nr:hypothetical protein TNIN_323812 [Trichonephila inaurata madagascariensis]